MKNILYSKKAFTLLELMIVVAIFGLLTVIGLPGIVKARKRARQNLCHNNMRIIANAVEQYTLEYSIPGDTPLALYNDTIMPTLDERIPDLFIPKHLTCPAKSIPYGEVNNSNLNVTCPIPVIENSHGTFGDLI